MVFTQSFPDFVYLNGEIFPAVEAKISVFDRGFLFGDGVYEVMSQKQGVFFRKAHHLSRLKQSLEALQIKFDAENLFSDIPALLSATGLSTSDCLLYIQITRGIAPRQHAFPSEITPTVMMYAWPKSLPEINSTLAKVVIQEEFRWSRCDIKSTSLLGNVMANQHASIQGSYETLLSRAGVITEASHCNVFFVKDGTVFTHPANNFILNGITRQAVLDLCIRKEIPFAEIGLRSDEIYSVDEAFLTGTSTQVMAISHIDDKIIGKGLPGEITKALQMAFGEEKRKLGMLE
jgi:D-alanine transaminase